MEGGSQVRGSSPGQRADLYQVLGVPADASRAEIARAYRQLARGAHPDTQGTDSAAAGRFQEITEAYRVLGDPARRARYDRAHPRPARGGRNAGSGAGHPQPGQPQAVPVRVRPGRPASRPPIWAGPVHAEPPEPHDRRFTPRRPPGPAWPASASGLADWPADDPVLAWWLAWLRASGWDW
jgi:curved DNA-binding protein CbpA